MTSDPMVKQKQLFLASSAGAGGQEVVEVGVAPMVLVETKLAMAIPKGLAGRKRSGGLVLTRQIDQERPCRLHRGELRLRHLVRMMHSTS